MNRNDRIEQEIHETLSCFNSVDEIEASPFFNARLHAKIKAFETNSNRPWAKIFTMEYLQPAFLLIFLVANILTATVVLDNKKAESLSRPEIMKILAEEYSLQQEEYSLLTFEK